MLARARGGSPPPSADASASASSASSDTVEGALEAALAAGRARWPDLPVAEEQFVAHLARSIEPGDPDPALTLARLHAADLYLACACAADLSGAIAAFEATYLADVGGALAGTVDLSPAEVDEVRQVVRVKLLVGGAGAGIGASEGDAANGASASASGEGTPVVARTTTPVTQGALIRGYSGRGGLAAWVRVAAVRTALTLIRDARIGQRAGQRAASEALDARGPLDPELDFLKVRYRRDFEQAFQAAMLTMPDRQRALLRLNVVAGLTLEKIGAIYGVDRSTVSRWLAQAREELLRETERGLRDRLGVAPAEFQSIARLVTSQLDIDLPELLKTASRPSRP